MVIIYIKEYLTTARVRDIVVYKVLSGEYYEQSFFCTIFKNEIH